MSSKYIIDVVCISLKGKLPTLLKLRKSQLGMKGPICPLRITWRRCLYCASSVSYTKHILNTWKEHENNKLDKKFPRTFLTVALAVSVFVIFPAGTKDDPPDGPDQLEGLQEWWASLGSDPALQQFTQNETDSLEIWGMQKRKMNTKPQHLALVLLLKVCLPMSVSLLVQENVKQPAFILEHLFLSCI